MWRACVWGCGCVAWLGGVGLWTCLWGWQVGLGLVGAQAVWGRWVEGAQVFWWLGPPLTVSLSLGVGVLVWLRSRTTLWEVVARARLGEDRADLWAFARSIHAAATYYANPATAEDLTPQWAGLLAEAAGSGAEEAARTLAFLHSLFAPPERADVDPVACHRLLYQCVARRPAFVSELWARPAFLEDLVRSAWSTFEAGLCKNQVPPMVKTDSCKLLWEILKDVSAAQLGRFVGLESGVRLLVTALGHVRPEASDNLRPLLCCLHQLVGASLGPGARATNKQILLDLGLQSRLSILRRRLEGLTKRRPEVLSVNVLAEALRPTERPRRGPPLCRPPVAVPRELSRESRLCQALVSVQGWAALLAVCGFVLTAHSLAAGPTQHETQLGAWDWALWGLGVWLRLSAAVGAVTGLALVALLGLVWAELKATRWAQGQPDASFRSRTMLMLLPVATLERLLAPSPAEEAAKTLAFFVAAFDGFGGPGDFLTCCHLNYCFEQSADLRRAFWAQPAVRRQLYGLLEKSAASFRGFWRPLLLVPCDLCRRLLSGASAAERTAFVAEGGGEALVSLLAASEALLLRFPDTLHALLTCLQCLLTDEDLGPLELGLHGRVLADAGLGQLLRGISHLTQDTHLDDHYAPIAQAFLATLGPPAQPSQPVSRLHGPTAAITYPY